MDIMGKKTCSACGELKPYTEFHKHPQCVGGVNSKCKDCRRPILKKRYDVQRVEQWYELLLSLIHISEPTRPY